MALRIKNPALWFGTCLLIASLAVSASGQAPKQKKAKKSPAVPAAQVSQPAAETPPPPPPTLAQQPPQPAQVTYSGGLLSINAPNSTLGDVLNGIRRATGASVEGAGNPSDRVIVNLGPAAPRDVIAALLNGSRYDYILLGPPQQPAGIQKLVLMARSNQSASSAANANGNPSAPPAVNSAPPRGEDSDIEGSEDEEEPVPDREGPEPYTPPMQPPDQNAAPEGQQNAPQNQQPGNANPQRGATTPSGVGQPDPTSQPGAPAAQNPQQQQQNQIKTPEQLFRELQQLEQQRKQQQGQQNPQ